MTVLYADGVLAVCLKPAGVLAEDRGEGSMPALLRAQLGRDVQCVHRLDRAVGGVMVYAADAAWTGALTRSLQESGEKTYYAVAAGETQDGGTMCDLLYHDAKSNKTFVVRRQRRGVREARLEYETLARAEWQGQTLSLVRVRLHTGRTHQIRVQFASRATPLVGDRRYGSRIDAPVALWSGALSFVHPQTGERMTFRHAAPDTFPFSLFSARADCE